MTLDLRHHATTNSNICCTLNHIHFYSVISPFKDKNDKKYALIIHFVIRWIPKKTVQQMFEFVVSYSLKINAVYDGPSAR